MEGCRHARPQRTGEAKRIRGRKGGACTAERGVEEGALGRGEGEGEPVFTKGGCSGGKRARRVQDGGGCEQRPLPRGGEGAREDIWLSGCLSCAGMYAGGSVMHSGM